MQTEIEAKFLDIDVGRTRDALKALGAKLEFGERAMKRKIFEHVEKTKNDWFRVRDEGDKITLTYKNLIDRSVTGTQEISVVVSDFEKTSSLLLLAGVKNISYQETKREQWSFLGADITIDTWPWIPTFIEIEAPSVEILRDVVAKLHLDWDKALHGSVETAYQKYYDVTEEEVDHWPQITFIPTPEWLLKKKKTS